MTQPEDFSHLDPKDLSKLHKEIEIWDHNFPKLLTKQFEKNTRERKKTYVVLVGNTTIFMEYLFIGSHNSPVGEIGIIAAGLAVILTCIALFIPQPSPQLVGANDEDSLLDPQTQKQLTGAERNTNTILRNNKRIQWHINIRTVAAMVLIFSTVLIMAAAH